MLVWVSHRVFEWQAGFINLRQPSAHEFGGRLFLRSVTYEHTARFIRFSILTLHPGGRRSTKTALHHEVLLPAALLPVAGVPWIFSSHHRGKWEQTGSTSRGFRWCCCNGKCRTNTRLFNCYYLKEMWWCALLNIFLDPSGANAAVCTSTRMLPFSNTSNGRWMIDLLS